MLQRDWGFFIEMMSEPNTGKYIVYYCITVNGVHVYRWIRWNVNMIQDFKSKEINMDMEWCGWKTLHIRIDFSKSLKIPLQRMCCLFGYVFDFYSQFTWALSFFSSTSFDKNTKITEHIEKFDFSANYVRIWKVLSRLNTFGYH